MVQPSDVPRASGPNAPIVFAPWILMGFPQQRYDGVLSRYGQTVGEDRSNKHAPPAATA